MKKHMQNSMNRTLELVSSKYAFILAQLHVNSHGLVRAYAKDEEKRSNYIADDVNKN